MQNEKDQSPAPPYAPVAQQPTGQYEHPMENIQRPTPAQSPGPQMVMVPNVAPPQQQPTTPLNLLRDQPEHVFCPASGKVVPTRADSKDSDKTWFAVIGICLICPCVACFPLKGCCGDGMLQDWDQYCTGCGKQLTHRPYNKEAQIMRPDHDVQQGGVQQQQYAQPQYMQQQSQPQYAPH